MTDCIYDPSSLMNDIGNAVGHFEENTYDGVVHGLGDLSMALGDIGRGMHHCHVDDMQDTMNLLMYMVKEFSNPVSIVYHIGSDIIVNRVSIWHEIKAARKAFKEKNWKKFG